MLVVEDKYRGTKEYFLVFSALLTAAGYRGTVTYQQLACIVGLPPQGNHMGRELGQLLGEISDDEAQRKRPMLSAVAVGKSGKPGPGFFDLARSLGKLESTSRDEENCFWKREMAAVHKTWEPIFRQEA